MRYTHRYDSPLGGILLTADDEGLTGLWFDGQKDFARSPGPEQDKNNLPVFGQAFTWLDTYFSGRKPDFTPPLHLSGTAFQNEVWRLLLEIPRGQTTTYGELARQIAARRGRSHMSAQAVGGAVARNEISIIIPCHRVVGTDGSLTGYAGGIDRKIRLLTLEGADMARLFVPKRGTAL